MHKIYFEKRCIIICAPTEEALADPNSVEFHVGENANAGYVTYMGHTAYFSVAAEKD